MAVDLIRRQQVEENGAHIKPLAACGESGFWVLLGCAVREGETLNKGVQDGDDEMEWEEEKKRRRKTKDKVGRGSRDGKRGEKVVWLLHSMTMGPGSGPKWWLRARTRDRFRTKEVGGEEEGREREVDNYQYPVIDAIVWIWQK